MTIYVANESLLWALIDSFCIAILKRPQKTLTWVKNFQCWINALQISYRIIESSPRNRNKNKFWNFVMATYSSYWMSIVSHGPFNFSTFFFLIFWNILKNFWKFNAESILKLKLNIHTLSAGLLEILIFVMNAFFFFFFRKWLCLAWNCWHYHKEWLTKCTRGLCFQSISSKPTGENQFNSAKEICIKVRKGTLLIFCRW